MSNTYFSFKQFTVHQARSAMKVGTDAVLLGAWVRDLSEVKVREVQAAEAPTQGVQPTLQSTRMPEAKFGSFRYSGGMSNLSFPNVPCTTSAPFPPSITQPEVPRYLDVGTGTGIIALMLAQRFSRARVDALEPEASSCLDAEANFAASPWGDRLHLFSQRLQEYALGCTLPYDHIVTNPPYYVDALLSEDASRSRARHAICLSYGELLAGGAALLKPKGVLSLILPEIESRLFMREARQMGWSLDRRTEVFSTARSGVRRVLMQWSRCPQPSAPLLECASEPLVIHSAAGVYSESYRALTRDFYLHF